MPFSLDRAISLEHLEGLSDDERLASLMPMDLPVADLPGITLSADLAFFVRRGQAVLVPKVATRGLLRLVQRGSVSRDRRGERGWHGGPAADGGGSAEGLSGAGASPCRARETDFALFEGV